MFVRIHNLYLLRIHLFLLLLYHVFLFQTRPFRYISRQILSYFHMRLQTFLKICADFVFTYPKFSRQNTKRNLLLFLIPAKNFSLPLSIFYVSSKNTSIFPFAATVTSLHISFTWQQNFSCSFQITSFASSYTICLFPSTR